MPTQSHDAESTGAGMFPGGCVVLSRPQVAAPELLIRALKSRGLSVRLVHDEPSVMMLFAERSLGRRVLVVVDPPKWERLAELICAVHTYHGQVLCWQFSEQGNGQPRLKALDQRFSGPVQSDESDGDASDVGPVGRIVRRRPVDALLTRVPGRPLSTREVVTQQELTMLLGPMPGEAG